MPVAQPIAQDGGVTKNQNPRSTLGELNECRGNRDIQRLAGKVQDLVSTRHQVHWTGTSSGKLGQVDREPKPARDLEADLPNSNPHNGTNTKTYGAVTGALPGVSGGIPKKFIFFGIAAIGLVTMVTIQGPVHRRLPSQPRVLQLEPRHTMARDTKATICTSLKNTCAHKPVACFGCCCCPETIIDKSCCKGVDCRKNDETWESEGQCCCDKICCKSKYNPFKRNACTRCAAWTTCLWTCLGAVTAPLCYFGLYGGTQATCLKYDWYEQTLEGTGKTMEELFNGLDDGETLSLNYLANPTEGTDAGFVEIERIDMSDENDKYMFKITPQLGELGQQGPTSDVKDSVKLPTGATPAEERIPIIFAGGRGSFVEKMWNMDTNPDVGGNKIDVGEFPDKEKFTFYTMDYPGYSKSNPGMPGENAILEDYENLYNYVLQEEGKAPILAGYSLGTGTISGLAHEVLTDASGNIEAGVTEDNVHEKIAGMLYMNPFESMHDTIRDLDPTKGIVTGLGFPWLALQDEWNSVGRMADVSGLDIPTLIYSSNEDGIVKSENHRGLFDTITEQLDGVEDYNPDSDNAKHFSGSQTTTINNGRHILHQESGTGEHKVGHENVLLKQRVDEFRENGEDTTFWDSWINITQGENQ